MTYVGIVLSNDLVAWKFGVIDHTAGTACCGAIAECASRVESEKGSTANGSRVRYPHLFRVCQFILQFNAANMKASLYSGPANSEILMNLPVG